MKSKVWVEVNLENLEHNYRQIRKNIGEVDFLGVVKADAYGHGASEIALELEKLGANYLAVATLDEALAIRKSGVNLPILIFGHTPTERLGEVARNRLTQTVADYSQVVDYANFLKSEKINNLKIHLKIDTGMSRYGFNAADVESTCDEIREILSFDIFDVEGIYTHLACSDGGSENFKQFTENQIEKFKQVIESLPKNLSAKIKIKHAANSGGIVNYPQAHFDMVRSGILLYGYEFGPNKIGVKPVISLKSRIEFVNFLKAGDCVGYDCTWRASEKSKIGVVPCGYNDGIPRNTQGFFVLVNGKKAPIVGRICMDVMMVDLTNIDAQVGDMVEIYGTNNSLNDLAEKSNTIPYEILCRIGSRVEKIYL